MSILNNYNDSGFDLLRYKEEKKNVTDSWIQWNGNGNKNLFSWGEMWNKRITKTTPKI